MDMPVLPTPPATQALVEPYRKPSLPTRHERFYSMGPMLRDPVILQVQCPLACIHSAKAHVLLGRKYPVQAFHLCTAQGCDFFASIFSIDNGDTPEGKSDEHPVFLPSTVTCAEFDVFLRFGIE